MNWLVPSFCFFLALVMLVCGFALWSTGPPEVNIELHQARLGDDDAYRELLEGQLGQRQRGRKMLTGCLFAGSAAMVVAAFLTMRPAEKRRAGR